MFLFCHDKKPLQILVLEVTKLQSLKNHVKAPHVHAFFSIQNSNGTLCEITIGENIC